MEKREFKPYKTLCQFFLDVIMLDEANFFWSGEKFGFLEKIVIKSHKKVGHNPQLWLFGEEPQSLHWKDIRDVIILHDANEIFNVKKFLSDGGNERTAAALWRFHFLFEKGGIYCDTDAFALKKFPDDPWIVCSAQNRPDLLSIGVLKSPRKNLVFQKCIENIKLNWGNVGVFTEAYKEVFKNTNSTHDNLLFYPYRWQECKKLFTELEIPNSYSVHFYTKALEDLVISSSKKRFFKDAILKDIQKIESLDEKWCEKHPKTLLGKLQSWLST